LQTLFERPPAPAAVPHGASDYAIRIEGLGKSFRIGQRRQAGTLRDAIGDLAAAPFRAFSRRAAGASDGAAPAAGTFWALRDVSFSIPRGDVVGIVGRNGAGKSTLLKILSGITEPSTGSAAVRGRMGSLLEVGTGFHPELTGRENVFLNGAILGMSRAEIARKFDDIVDFAEVSAFIDTPAKHYSTGMYMRLAFAVAAHLDPDILVVDEVLAVGDAAFQRRCLGKMSDVTRAGRTVLFVSHQMNQIRRLCTTCVWLDGGRVRQIGPTSEVLAAYEATDARGSGAAGRDPAARQSQAPFVRWDVVEPRHERPNVVRTTGPVTVRFLVHTERPIRHGYHGIALFNADRQLIWGTSTRGLDFAPGASALVYTLPGLPLRPGTYSWQVSLYDDNGELLDMWHGQPDLVIATEPMGHADDAWNGVLNFPYELAVRAAPASQAPAQTAEDH
jgi:lipopolysaccharide transport system ATP-binding protein